MNYDVLYVISNIFFYFALASAAAATVLCFIFIIPDKADKKRGLIKFLHDFFSFKYFVIEKILLAVYIFLTAYSIIRGVLFLVDFFPTWNGLYALIYIIAVPIALRIIYELVMMFVLLAKNVIQINNKLKSDKEVEDPFKSPEINFPKKEAAPASTPVDAPASAPAFCPKCGSKLNPDGKCPVCDK